MKVTGGAVFVYALVEKLEAPVFYVNVRKLSGRVSKGGLSASLNLPL